MLIAGAELIISTGFVFVDYIGYAWAAFFFSLGFGSLDLCHKELGFVFFFESLDWSWLLCGLYFLGHGPGLGSLVHVSGRAFKVELKSVREKMLFLLLFLKQFLILWVFLAKGLLNMFLCLILIFNF
jgi:hypothetical protein